MLDRDAAEEFKIGLVMLIDVPLLDLSLGIDHR